MAPSRRNPETIGELWIFAEERFNQIDQRLTAFSTAQQGLANRIDALETLRDQLLPRVPNIVDDHDKRLDALEAWKTTVVAIAGAVGALGAFTWTVLAHAVGAILSSGKTP